MNYQKIYDDICKRGQERILPMDVYTEKHHIIPKCMDGTDEKSNLTVLTAREHFLVHYILAEKLYPNSYKLWYAFWRMCKMQNPYQTRYKPSSKVYNELRTKISLLQSQRSIGELNPMFGKIVSEHTKDKIKEKRKVRVGKLSPNYGKTFSEEWKKNLSKPGEKNGFYGKHHSEETKEKLRKKALLRPCLIKRPLVDMDGNIYESRKSFMEITGISESKMYELFKQNKLKNVCKD